MVKANDEGNYFVMASLLCVNNGSKLQYLVKLGHGSLGTSVTDLQHFRLIPTPEKYKKKSISDQHSPQPCIINTRPISFSFNGSLELLACTPI